MNIRLRLTLWYTAILLLILLIFGVIVYIGLSRNLSASLDSQLQREAKQMVDAFNAGEIEESEEGYEDNESSEYGGRKIRLNGIEFTLNYLPEEGVFWQILDSSGQSTFNTNDFRGATFETTTLNPNRAQLSFGTLANSTPIRAYTLPVTLEGNLLGFVQVAESYEPIQNVQRQLIILFGASLPFVLFAAGGGGWFLASRALAPIDRITRSAQEISADHLHQRLNLDLPNDEVGRLAATFDDMLARLDDAFERQKRFIADASHEMRTPLTILKGDVEVALNRSRSPEEYQETLEMVNQTADRLSALVEELFLLARADNNQIPFQTGTVDVVDLLYEQADHLQSRAAAKQVTLNLNTPDSLPLIGDRDKLVRLFLNLIDNAIKYSRFNDKVDIIATAQSEEVCIEIRDTGPGIPAENIPHLFDRFYRVDKARAHQASDGSGGSGAGLGLAIAHWLAQVHGGRIEVSSQLGHGTTFAVYLPR